MKLTRHRSHFFGRSLAIHMPKRSVLLQHVCSKATQNYEGHSPLDTPVLPLSLYSSKERTMTQRASSKGLLAILCITASLASVAGMLHDPT